MSVPEQTPVNQFIIAGGETGGPWTWNLQKESELVVTKQLASTGAVVPLALNIHYTVNPSGLGNDNGGTISFIGSELPATAGDIWTLSRNTTINRSADFATSGAFLARTINEQLDNPIRIAQDRKRDLDTAVHKDLGIGDTLNPLIPQMVDERVLKFRDTGGGNFELAMSDKDPDVEADKAAASAAEALASEQAAALSESNASTSESNASTSESNASTSESNASTSESNAANSETAANLSKIAADVSAFNASNSETAAGNSAGNAATSETNASNSETAAGISETNAGTSETNANIAVLAAGAFATAASNSAGNAATSETNAGNSETAADISETNAGNSETNAGNSETNAGNSETNAGNSETNAGNSETSAGISETNAAASAAQLAGTSTTLILIGGGIKVFTTQSGKFFDAGSNLLITSDADPNNFMFGNVTTYSGTTLTLNITALGGSGGFSDWTIRVSGVEGPAGVGGALLAVNNLSDLNDPAIARNNLGVAPVSFRGALVEKAPAAFQSITSSFPTTVDWGAEKYDTDNIHNNLIDNSRLTVPAGVTRIVLKGSVEWDPGLSGHKSFRIQKAGAEFLGMPAMLQEFAINSTLEQCITSAAVTVVGGDYFECLVFQNSGGAITIDPDPNSWFSMEIIE